MFIKIYLLLSNLLDANRLKKLLLSSFGMPLLCALGGVLNSMGLAPVASWPFTILGYVLFMVVLSFATTKKQVFLYTLVFFSIYSLISLSWLSHVMEGFGEMPSYISWPVIALGVLTITSLPYALFNTFAFTVAKKHQGVFLCAFMPLAFILGDFFVGVFLTGFPWLYAGYSCIEGPLKNYASLIGVRGISALLYIISGAVALTALRKFLYLPIAAVILTVGILIEGATALKRIEPMNVALVQGNVEVSVHNNGENLESILGKYWALTSEVINKNTLVLWSESTLPMTVEYGYEVLVDLDKIFKLHNANLVTGLFRTSDKSYYNSMAILGAGVTDAGFSGYNKRVLVPFGEIVPFEELLRPLGSIFVIPNSSFDYGQDNQKPLHIGTHEFTPAICYEAIFPEVIRSLDNEKTNGLIMISNDTWFAGTKAPRQHLNIARMRSMELSKPMLRCTNSGITAYINEKGEVVSELASDVAGVLEVKFYPVTGQSLYSRYGNLGVLIIMLLLLGTGIYGRFIRKETPEDSFLNLIKP